MIYGLKNTYGESWTFCDPSKRFAPSYGPVKEKAIFSICLEEYLQEGDGNCPFPGPEHPWEFYKAETQQDLEEGRGELIASLHNGTPEALWELYHWCRGGCVKVGVSLSY